MHAHIKDIGRIYLLLFPLKITNRTNSIKNLYKTYQKMCFQVVCDDCKKITYGGCGRHMESALRGVPEDKKCKCSKNGRGTKRG